MRIGIVGSRRRNTQQDYEKVRDAFWSVVGTQKDISIVSGGASSGADKFAEHLAKHFGYTIVIHRPNYAKYWGKQAPLIRNGTIAQDSDVLIACVAEDRKGGTEDTIRKFKKHHPDGRLILV